MTTDCLRIIGCFRTSPFALSFFKQQEIRHIINDLFMHRGNCVNVSRGNVTHFIIESCSKHHTHQFSSETMPPILI